jgi:GT2 family glycosyltransferase
MNVKRCDRVKAARRNASADEGSLSSPCKENSGDVPLCVVIVSHGRCHLLDRTLQSLESAERPAGYQGTLVVENGERFGAQAVVERFERSLQARYLFTESGRKTVALNLALAKCGDTLAVFFDDDVRIAPGTLTAYAAAARKCGRGWYFGGPTGVDYEIPPPRWLCKFLPPSAKGMSFATDAETIAYPQYFLGFNWAAYAADLRRCGGFPTEFGPGTPSGGGDETFMQLSLNRAGIRGRVVSSAMVWHHVPRSRCAPDWALSRARGSAFNEGIYDEHTRRLRDQRFRLARAVGLYALRRLRVRELLKVLAFRPGAIFSVRCRLACLAAFTRGCVHGTKHRPFGNRDVLSEASVPQLPHSIGS